MERVSPLISDRYGYKKELSDKCFPTLTTGIVKTHFSYLVSCSTFN
jgi:hypothetical protein